MTSIDRRSLLRRGAIGGAALALTSKPSPQSARMPSSSVYGRNGGRNSRGVEKLTRFIPTPKKRSSTRYLRDGRSPALSISPKASWAAFHGMTLGLP
jgi:hypothetical protein